MKFLNYLLVLLFFGMISSCTAPEEPQKLETGWYYIVKKDREDLVQRVKLNTQDTFLLNPIPVITPPHFSEVMIYSGMVGGEGLQVRLNEEGTKVWADATKLYARNYMGFVIDDELVHVQRIAMQYIDGVTTLNEKWFDKTYLEETAEKLNLLITQGQSATKSETPKKPEPSK